MSDDQTLSAPELENRALSATPSQGSSASVTNNARVDNPVTCRNLLDHVTPPGYLAMLRNQHDVGFLDSFNINSTHHVCMVFELRLRYENEIMMREKYEKKFTDSFAMVQQRDVEVAELKAKLEKSKSEDAEVKGLRQRVFDLEATFFVKVGEAASLTARNAGLLEKVSALKLKRDGLKSQVVVKAKMREEFVSYQDAAELDARIADVRRDMDNDLYPHMLTAIAGRRWVVGHDFILAFHKCARSFECRSALGKVILMAINKGIKEGLEAGVVHGRAGRYLAQIEVYDPKVERKYVATVSEFEGVSFPLLDELEGLKDSPLALIMSALTLKDDQGNIDTTPEFARFQPFLDQV
nr:putative transposase (putative), gypsy type [Tanacetum cinerariifolium]